MKQFEKFWKIKYNDWPPLRKSEKKYAKEAWKTALEWVLKDLYTPLSPIAAETIRKELDG